MSVKSRKPQKVILDPWKVAMAFTDDVEGVICPDHVSLIKGLIRARDYVRLAELPDVIGFAYLNPFSHYVINQIAAFFKKSTAFADEDVCTRSAIESFKLAESECRETNLRLRYLDALFFSTPEPGPWPNGCGSDLLRFKPVILRMQRLIRQVLGDVTVCLDSIPESIRLTSGATSTSTRQRSTPYHKVSRNVEITRAALPILLALFPNGEVRPRVVECNKVAFVPKNFKTHRAIAAEPKGLLPLQLAVERHLVRRLRRVGQDLRDQSRNKSLAQLGSTDGSLATIDLSRASDTMSLELVPFLFPEEWTKLLLRLRTPFGKLPDGLGLIKYEKFSSMGNGITFPLETLIFWSAAKAVSSINGVQGTVSVYGDDIVVDTSLYSDVVEVLSLLGFTVNKEKSFHNGPFRESCGGDYFNGHDVRPFFFRGDVEQRVSDACHTINGLASVATPGGRLADYLADVVRRYRLPLVPWNEDTTSGIHIHPWHAHGKGLMKRDPELYRTSYHSLYFRGYTTINRRWVKRDAKSYALWHLKRITSLDPVVSSEIPRESVTRFKWVRWRMPAVPAPDHLFWWSGRLTALQP